MNLKRVRKLIEENSIEISEICNFNIALTNSYQSYFAEIQYEIYKKYPKYFSNKYEDFDEDTNRDVKYEYYSILRGCLDEVCSDVGCYTSELKTKGTVFEFDGADVMLELFDLKSVIEELVTKYKGDNLKLFTIFYSIYCNISDYTHLGQQYKNIFQKHIKDWGLNNIFHELKEKIFVAMAFNKETTILREKIKSTIIEFNYDPVLIDEAQFNGQIVDKMLNEIRTSKYLVADFTFNRGGVYFEAGYGLALGKPVIMCVREDYLEEIHFDTKQFKYIVWTTEDNLKDMLKERIKSLEFEI